MTDDQKKAVGSLREMLTGMQLIGQAGAPSSDTDMARFLMARKWDVPKAAEMYNKMVQWRKEMGVDGILATFQFPQYEQVAQMYPMFYCGTGDDRLGACVPFPRIASFKSLPSQRTTCIDLSPSTHSSAHSRSIALALSVPSSH